VFVITLETEQYHITDLGATCLFVVCLVGADFDFISAAVMPTPGGGPNSMATRAQECPRKFCEHCEIASLLRPPILRGITYTVVLLLHTFQKELH
jgi:hypothetical protein